jgi:hypothetical protein
VFFCFTRNIDTECYDTFDFLFHPVIGDYHKVDVAKLKQINNMGNPNDIDELKPEDQKCINSTRARVGRTVKGFPMANKLTREVFSTFLRIKTNAKTFLLEIKG